MSRGFFGGSGGGGKKSSSKDKNKDMIAKLAQFKRKMSVNEMIKAKSSYQLKSHKEMVEDLIDEMMFNPNRKRYGKVHLPGTTAPEEREMTKGYKEAMEFVKAKRLTKRAKQRAKKVEIVAKSFGSGRITASGKIMNAAGKIVAEVDPNTGAITDSMGVNIGKYDPHSYTNATKIERIIQKGTAKAAVFNPLAPKS